MVITLCLIDVFRHFDGVTVLWQGTILNEIYLEAVKICLELVHMALMGLSWPLISPMGVKLSTFHTFSIPPRQPLSSMGLPGTYARAHTQSLWAFGICCEFKAERCWKLKKDGIALKMNPVVLQQVCLWDIWVTVFYKEMQRNTYAKCLVCNG